MDKTYSYVIVYVADHATTIAQCEMFTYEL